MVSVTDSEFSLPGLRGAGRTLSHPTCLWSKSMTPTQYTLAPKPLALSAWEPQEGKVKPRLYGHTVNPWRQYHSQKIKVMRDCVFILRLRFHSKCGFVSLTCLFSSCNTVQKEQTELLDLIMLRNMFICVFPQAPSCFRMLPGGPRSGWLCISDSVDFCTGCPFLNPPTPHPKRFHCTHKLCDALNPQFGFLSTENEAYMTF